jgi:hypothetical protein
MIKSLPDKLIRDFTMWLSGFSALVSALSMGLFSAQVLKRAVGWLARPEIDASLSKKSKEFSGDSGIPDEPIVETSEKPCQR